MRKVIGLVLAALILAVLLPSVASAATSPQAEWYFAEGTTRQGFEEYLCIANPNTAGGFGTRGPSLRDVRACRSRFDHRAC